MLAGVELGGTKCICILARDVNNICEQVEVPTTSPDETLSAIIGIIGQWNYTALGIASFGPLDLSPQSAHFGSLINTTKPHWSGVSLLPLANGKPFAIDTDVNGAALAEGLWGAAQRLESWAYITAGTGIGVGSICNGMPLRGLGHSEAGHQRVPRLAGDGFKGNCTFHADCVEGLASGPAIEARAGLRGCDVARDDPTWNCAAHALAMLCHNLVLTTLPQRILIGGGVAMGQPQMLPLIRQHLSESLTGYAATSAIDFEIFITQPGLGSKAGPLGALAIAYNAKEKS